jgi:hypothetical protein
MTAESETGRQNSVGISPNRNAHGWKWTEITFSELLWQSGVHRCWDHL